MLHIYRDVQKSNKPLVNSKNICYFVNSPDDHFVQTVNKDRLNGGTRMTIDRRQEIINAATRSFSLFGFRATTMEQVAKLANVGKGTIYTFFKNKEDLFNEIIVMLIHDMKNEATKAYDSNVTFQENLHLALYKMLEFRLEHQLTIKLIQEDHDFGTPAVQEVMEKLEASIIDFLSERISRAIEKGEIKQCHPRITAFVLLKLYVALIFDWEKDRNPFSEAEIADLFDLYIFRGLAND